MSAPPRRSAQTHPKRSYRPPSHSQIPATQQPMPSTLCGAIQKKKRPSSELVGRRVQVPQRFTDVPDDGDGFTFGATIINGDAKRVTILYDYTGEVESWASALCKRWLEPDCDPLCRALESACLSGLNSASGRSVEPRLLSPPMLAMYAAGE